MWGCGKTSAGRDEYSCALGLHTQYPWRHTNVFTGVSRWSDVIVEAKSVEQTKKGEE